VGLQVIVFVFVFVLVFVFVFASSFAFGSFVSLNNEDFGLLVCLWKGKKEKE